MGFCPAKALEDMLGIEGISANWKMPEGKDIDSIEEKVGLQKGSPKRHIRGIAEDLFWIIHDKRDSYACNSITYEFIDFIIGNEERRRAKLYNAVWNNLIKENPALGQVNVDRNNSRSLWDAIRGCISQFNADDINYFLHHSIEERNRVEYKTLEAALTEKGVKWQWIASPETMQKILQALEKKENAQTQDSQPLLIPSDLWQKRISLRQQQPEAEKAPTHTKLSSNMPFL